LNRYWIKGECEGLKSSTGFIHQFFAEFDSDRIIGFIMRGKKYKTDPEYKYVVRSVRTLLSGLSSSMNGLTRTVMLIHEHECPDSHAERFTGVDVQTNRYRRYYKMTKEAIKKMWSDNGNAASSAGTIM